MFALYFAGRSETSIVSSLATESAPLPLTVFVATDGEFKAVAEASDEWRGDPESRKSGRGRVGKMTFQLFQTDMGPTNAARVARQVFERNTENDVLIVGISGALSPEISFGGTVICPEIVAETGDSMTCDADLTARLEKHFAGSKTTFHRGRGVTTNRVICSTAEKRRLFETYGGLTVDMESHSILSTAHEFGLRVGVVRVVSDDARHDLPEMNAAFDADFNVRYLKMIAALVSSPIDSARFLKNLRPAGQALGKAFRVALGAEKVQK